MQVHGHYADAGEVAALIASTMASTEAVDMVMTGHSLGRNKLEHLLASGTAHLSSLQPPFPSPFPPLPAVTHCCNYLNMPRKSLQVICNPQGAAFGMCGPVCLVVPAKPGAQQQAPAGGE